MLSAGLESLDTAIAIVEWTGNTVHAVELVPLSVWQIVFPGICGYSDLMLADPSTLLAALREIRAGLRGS